MKIEITQEQLDNLVEMLELVQSRLELEATALLNAPKGRRIAIKRLEQAGKAAALADFFLHL